MRLVRILRYIEKVAATLLGHKSDSDCAAGVGRSGRGPQGGPRVEFTVERTEHTVVVVLKTDRLDANNAQILKRAMESVLRDAKNVVIDLGSVRFMDSSGIGALLSCLRQVNAAGGQLRLCSVQEPVRQIMDLVRMHRVFTICATREEAIEAGKQVSPTP